MVAKNFWHEAVLPAGVPDSATVSISHCPIHSLCQQCGTVAPVRTARTCTDFSQAAATTTAASSGLCTAARAPASRCRDTLRKAAIWHDSDSDRSAMKTAPSVQFVGFVVGLQSSHDCGSGCQWARRGVRNEASVGRKFGPALRCAQHATQIRESQTVQVSQGHKPLSARQRLGGGRRVDQCIRAVRIRSKKIPNRHAISADAPCGLRGLLRKEQMDT